MRLTSRLCAQHLGWTFKKHWQVQGRRVPHDTGAAAELQKLGIAVKDANDVANPKPERIEFDFDAVYPKPLTEDETHPNWHKNAAYTYGNANVLLEGMQQAQLLTKTIEIQGFPKNIEESIVRAQLPSNVHRNIQNAIMASHVFDAEQMKLPKIKIAERPAFNLPRIYGISHQRRNRLLINKLIAECERIAGRTVNSNRRLIDNVDFKVLLPQESTVLQFIITAEKFITSNRPLEAVKGHYNAELPDIFPLKSTITMPKKHIYTMDTCYPFKSTNSFSHPHTIFLHFNKQTVGNLHDSIVKNTQLQSRTMLKAFAVAATRAKQLYGSEFQGDLAKPIVVQSIQTDGRTFHFGIFQLNTLQLSSATEGIKNYWFHEHNMDLFANCGYDAGRPHLDGYNNDVIRCLNAFYCNN